LALFYKNKQEVVFYSWDIRSPHVSCIKKVRTLPNIQDACSLLFTQAENMNVVQTISSALSASPSDCMETSPELRFLKKQAKLLNKDLVLLNADFSTVQVFQGDIMMIKFNLAKQFGAGLGLNKASMLEGFSFAHKSAVNLHLSTGHVHRVEMRVLNDDFLVQSIFKLCKLVLP
jgi:hypothetical protein